MNLITCITVVFTVMITLAVFIAPVVMFYISYKDKDPVGKTLAGMYAFIIYVPIILGIVLWVVLQCTN